MAKKLGFLSLLLASLALVPEVAHLLEMYHKMELTEQSYGVVQYIYRDWTLLGMLQLGAVICTGILLFLVPKGGPAFQLILVALICLILPLIIFFIVIFPVNLATQNWEVLPQNWMQLRNRWEYGHAINAILATTAYVLLLVALQYRVQL